MTRATLRESGFTLLEVLIALIILALVFSASFFSLGTTTRNLLSLHDKTAAQWVGMNVIARTQLGLIKVSEQASRATGTDKMFNTSWGWVLEVHSTPDKYTTEIVVRVGKADGPPNLIVLTGYLPR